MFVRSTINNSQENGQITSSPNYTEPNHRLVANISTYVTLSMNIGGRASEYSIHSMSVRLLCLTVMHTNIKTTGALFYTCHTNFLPPNSFCVQVQSIKQNNERIRPRMWHASMNIAGRGSKYRMHSMSVRLLFLTVMHTNTKATGALFYTCHTNVPSPNNFCVQVQTHKTK